MKPWDGVIREVLNQARRAAGGGAALADALKGAGVGPDSGIYSESAVSNWIKGRTRPPADVVVAAATLYRLSLDQALGLKASTEPATLKAWSSDVDHLRSEFARLEALVNTRLPTHDAGRQTSVKDLVAAYSTRAEFQAAEPLEQTLTGAESVDAMGLSLNAFCQGMSDVTLIELIENGLHLRCLFLDPDGEAIGSREREEAHDPGYLADLTRTNMRLLLRLRDQLTKYATDRLQVRTYDETVRFNITITNSSRAIIQPYLQHSRGVDSPTFIIERSDDEPHGLFPVFENVFAATWSSGRDVPA